MTQIATNAYNKFIGHSISMEVKMQCHIDILFTGLFHTDTLYTFAMRFGLSMTLHGVRVIFSHAVRARPIPSEPGGSEV